MEGWFVQNVLFGSMPVDLKSSAHLLQQQVVVIIALGAIDQELLKLLNTNLNKIVLMHMGDEKGEHFNQPSYELCDVILRNYYFPEQFLLSSLKGKLNWVPNGYKTGVGPRPPGTVCPSNLRRKLATFMGWLDNSSSFNDERNSFRVGAAACADKVDVYGNARLL